MKISFLDQTRLFDDLNHLTSKKEKKIKSKDKKNKSSK